MAEHGERVEVVVDAATARWLRGCAGRGEAMAAAAARQLRELALRDAAQRIDDYFRDHPNYYEDMTAEREAAFAEAAGG